MDKTELARRHRKHLCPGCGTAGIREYRTIAGKKNVLCYVYKDHTHDCILRAIERKVLGRVNKIAVAVNDNRP